jgi:DNA-binding NarL/FixJ family response regulator
LGDRIRLLIVDDHEVVRAGLRSLFDRVGRVEVVGEAADLKTAVEASVRLAPDVALVDLRLGADSGVEVCRRIMAAAPATRVLILTAYADEVAAAAAVSAGARGFLLKGMRGRDLIRAVKGSDGPATVIDAGVARRMLGHEPSGPPAVALGAAETDLAGLIADGMTNHAIAERSGTPEATVKAQVSRLLARLGVVHRSEVPARLAALSAASSAEPPTGER